MQKRYFGKYREIPAANPTIIHRHFTGSPKTNFIYLLRQLAQILRLLLNISDKFIYYRIYSKMPRFAQLLANAVFGPSPNTSSEELPTRGIRSRSQSHS